MTKDSSQIDIYYDDFSWFPESKFTGMPWQWQLENDSVLHIKLSKKISERLLARPGDRSGNPLASAVFNASCQRDTDSPQDVIVKVWMRIPNIDWWRPDGSVYVSDLKDYIRNPSNEEEEAPCYPYESEWDVGSQLTRLGCSSTPKYLFQSNQAYRNPWIRGNYMYFIVEEAVPGVPLSEIWTFPDIIPDDAEDIIKAFKQAFLEMANCAVGQEDTAPRNVLWDQKNQKCYLIDFEHGHIVDTEPPNPLWTWETYCGSQHPDTTLQFWDLLTLERWENIKKFDAERERSD